MGHRLGGKLEEGQLGGLAQLRLDDVGHQVGGHGWGALLEPTQGLLVGLG
jgi:hypothetical protein